MNAASDYLEYLRSQPYFMIDKPQEPVIGHCEIHASQGGVARVAPWSEVPFPIVMGRRVTRDEVIEGIRECYREMCALKRRWDDPGFVRYPDMETILDHIEHYGLPPK